MAGCRRERWLAATGEIQRTLLGRVDRAEALALVAARARETAGADLCVVVLEQDDGRLLVEAVAGSSEGVVGTALPRYGALAEVVDRGSTVRLTEGASAIGLEGLAAAMLVPLTGPGGAGGALVVGWSVAQGDGRLEDPDVKALRGFAAQVALALDRAQAQEDRSALAVLVDRDRIARDLHDLVIQRLFATGLSLQGAARLVGDADVAERLGRVVDDLDQTIRDIRGTIFELGRTEEVPDLRGQIRDVVAGAEAILGFRPRLTLHGPLDTAVPEVVGPHLVAVLIETLSNAARHAQARQVEVGVAVEGSGSDASVVATVSDDGKGFSGPRRESGLRNLRDRASSLGGSCQIESGAGAGTIVRWRAPLNRSAG